MRDPTARCSQRRTARGGGDSPPGPFAPNRGAPSLMANPDLVPLLVPRSRNRLEQTGANGSEDTRNQANRPYLGHTPKPGLQVRVLPPLLDENPAQAGFFVSSPGDKVSSLYPSMTCWARARRPPSSPPSASCSRTSSHSTDPDPCEGSDGTQPGPCRGALFERGAASSEAAVVEPLDPFEDGRNGPLRIDGGDRVLV